MGMLNSLEVRKGHSLLLEGTPYLVMDVTVQTPSARGANTLIKAKVRNLINGAVLAKTFKGGEKLEEAELDTTPAQFLYSMEGEFHFMDLESYEQFTLTTEDVGDVGGFLLEQMELLAIRFEGRVITLRLPNTVNLRVEQADPVVRGDTVSAQPKSVTLQTGLVLSVPPHVKTGDVIKVDTRTGKYVERVSF